MNKTIEPNRTNNKFIYVVVLIVVLSSIWIFSDAGNRSHSSAVEYKLSIDFVVQDLSGKEFKGSSLLGKTVLLDFWAVWCAPCIAAFPQLNELGTELKDKNFEIIGITLYSGNSEDIQSTLDQHTVDYPIYVGDNDEISQRYRIIGFPTYHLITPKGDVYKKYVGESPDLFDRIKADVELINAEHNQVALIQE